MQGYKIEESQRWPPPSRRSRKDSGIIESKSEVLRTRCSDVPGQEEMDVPAQKVRVD